MEGNQEQLSSESDDLSFWSLLKNDCGDLGALYPPLPDDYFRDKEDVFVQPRGGSKWPIIPYIRRVDLNNNPDIGDECNKPRNAWEMGIRGTF